MEEYAAVYRAHRLQIPKRFNFGRDVVDAWAADSEKTALVWCDAGGSERILTFADVTRESNQVANWLASQGVTKGDRVIIMLPRIPEWQICLVACLKLGTVPIP